MTNNGKSKTGKIFEAAQRVLRVSNGIVISLCCYILCAVLYITSSGTGRHTAEESTAANIQANIGLSGMLFCIESCQLYLLAYVRNGSKKLFGKINSRITNEESTATSSGTSSSGAS